MRAALQFILALLLLGMPLLVLLGVERWGLRPVAGVLATAAALRLALGGAQRHFAHIALLVLATHLVLTLSAALFAEPTLLLLVPVAINGVLLAVFAASLGSPTPLIERFARAQVNDLSAAERQYCRSVTWVWCGFFLLNGGVALALALWAPLAWWSLYNGLLAYALMGSLFAIEYAVRKRRFGRFGTGWPDRVLRRLLPEGSS